MSTLGIPSFDSQTRAFRIARGVLARRLPGAAGSGDWADPADPATAELLAREVLPAFDRIGRGIALMVRAGDADQSEMRALLVREGLALVAETEAEHMAVDRERAVLLRRRPVIDRSGPAILAAARHAAIVFMLIPHLPVELVTWPQPRLGSGYTDVFPPSGPGQLVERVEELDAVLWRLAFDRPVEPDDHFRRTYAFCETATWHDPGLPAMH